MLLRPATPGDVDFLRELYADTRAEEFVGIGWPADQIATLLAMQFEAQHTDYTRRFPASSHDIVLDGLAPIGRIWVNRAPDEIRLLDLAIHSSFRNRGIGSRLIHQLQAEATSAGRPLRHSVVKENLAALRLYHRLGFEIVGGVESHHLMEYTAPTP
ncbi:GNAT family N-acetyltransferase [Ilumatobacter coccineus]|uniref:N-acetyltransferase domain-containing protein n=1 Tax=Ilumatobacter coccineus (strain NBRC 103263 / KCTC 29153 / YM16-304) TaxID=1313172 RepID=A0A6C7ED07_ILUCY|nr:N-acetyltransferase [Ilumatobacter coccineus]BAN04250.1 hypothetical protein YM304_39360 [Ilumatobacter coccineus YM16-304]